MGQLDSRGSLLASHKNESEEPGGGGVMSALGVLCGKRRLSESILATKRYTLYTYVRMYVRHIHEE